MQKRKHYTKQFKLEAVRLFDSGDIPASDLARQLGIRRNQLHKWKPEPKLIAHSDQGQPYASRDYRARMKQYEMLQSMSRKGDCWDNAVAESFFASLEFELIDQQVFASSAEAKRELFEYIKVFYNRQRPHQTLDYQTPAKVDESYRLVA